MAAPDPFKAMPAATEVLRGPQELGLEADFADLAARFAAKSGGGLSPELSAELALEIVLNEIVEQACQITGATGAAIVIDRDGELVCRASSGSTAPELGSRMDKSIGLSAESLRTRKTLWCDDTFTDSRAVADPLKRLGIRSVVIMPLLRDNALIGIFELFSTEPYAFGVRDERTLETLADRTLTNLEHVSQPFDSLGDPIGAASDLQHEDMQKIGLQDVSLPDLALHNLTTGEPSPVPGERATVNFPLPDFPLQTASEYEISNASKATANAVHAGPSDFAFPEGNLEDVNLEEMTPGDIRALLENAGVIAPESEPLAGRVDRNEAAPRQLQLQSAPQLDLQPEPIAAPSASPKQVDYVSWTLGFAIVSVAVLLGLVLGQHFVLSHTHLAARVVPAVQRPLPVQKSTDPTSGSSIAAVKPARENEKSESAAAAEHPARVPDSHNRTAVSAETVPPGGLLVMENGKEVFRMPPSGNQDASSSEQLMQPASDLQPDPASERVVDIPEATEQKELLHRVEPEYPEAARSQNIEGRVVLEVHIGVDGSVQDVRTVSGPPVLAQASTDAVKQWQFKPRVVNGTPVEMQTRVTFDFKLPQ